MPKKGKQSAKTEQAPRPSFKGVSKRLRAVLAERECTIPEMMTALDPSSVVKPTRARAAAASTCRVLRFLRI